MTRDQAITVLNERFHPVHVQEYVEQVEATSPDYWDTIPTPNILLEDMRLFVEALGMRGPHDNE